MQPVLREFTSNLWLRFDERVPGNFKQEMYLSFVADLANRVAPHQDFATPVWMLVHDACVATPRGRSRIADHQTFC